MVLDTGNTRPKLTIYLETCSLWLMWHMGRFTATKTANIFS